MSKLSVYNRRWYNPMVDNVYELGLIIHTLQYTLKFSYKSWCHLPCEFLYVILSL